jgi:hypothetical protein
LALKVRVAVPEPPVRLVGLIDVVSPVVPLEERDTVPEKWFKGVSVMVEDPVVLALVSTIAGFEEIVKS